MHQKYKFMEANLVSKKRRLKMQLPDISSSLELISKLRAKRDSSEDTNTQFLLSDSVYANATIPPTDKVEKIVNFHHCIVVLICVLEQVCLWLGANVMLEYSLDDAEELLTKNKESAEKNISQIAFDLGYLRDQMTITEVTMARLYNWDVKKRQEKKKEAGKA